MPNPQGDRRDREIWSAAAAGLAVAATGATMIAAHRLWIAALYGAICGDRAGSVAHCWACYAAPMLALAAVAAWRRAARADPVRVR